MRKYLFIGIILSAIILTGCGIIDGKKTLKDQLIIDREYLTTMELLRMKLMKDIYRFGPSC